jgi:nucleoside-diphosphate-sugar epimerase
MDFIWLRPFNPYGGRQRAGSLIPFIMRSVAAKTPLTLRKPLAQGDFIYVGDVARAIAAAVLRGKGIATYNVGSGKLTSMKKIVKLVCEEMGASKEYYTDFYADLRNVRKGIGWRPIVDIKAGIRKTVADFPNLNSKS